MPDRTAVRTRRKPSGDLPKDVRQTKGYHCYQSRPWVGPGPGDNVNLGLYRSEDHGDDPEAAISAAARASREFKKLLAGPPRRDVWQVIQALQRTTRFGMPVVARHILPPGVIRVGADGRRLVQHSDAPTAGYGVLNRPDLGTFPDPGRAWEALKAAAVAAERPYPGGPDPIRDRVDAARRRFREAAGELVVALALDGRPPSAIERAIPRIGVREALKAAGWRSERLPDGSHAWLPPAATASKE